MIFKHKFRVRWVDTDTAGVMHFSNYFRYFEACEEEFYRSLGMEPDLIRGKYGIMLPRVETACQYKAACRYNDAIEVTLKVREVGTKTVTYDFQILNEARIAAEGFVKCIAVNLDWKVVDLPEEFTKILRKSTL